MESLPLLRCIVLGVVTTTAWSMRDASAWAAAPEADTLETCFLSPPQTARPRTYWFHMSGNITSPGITADLEAMKEIGLAGTLFMNVSVSIPTGLVETKDFFSPGWQDCFQHMLRESARLGLEFGSAVCDGWGNAGGPAIPPELAMQRLTWVEKRCAGGENVDLENLPRPFTNLDYYQRVAVLAIPRPANEASTSLLGRKDLRIPRAATGPAEIRWDTPAPVTVRELTLTGLEGQNPFGDHLAILEASDDGRQWRAVKPFPLSWRGYGNTDLTVVFDPVTARHFRLLVPHGCFSQQGSVLKMREAAFFDRGRIHFWQAKSAAISHNEHGGGAARYLDRGAADSPGIDPAQILDLTNQRRWKAPPGDWTIIDIGHTPTGAHNAPATRAGVGLECDKLSPRGIDAQYQAFLDPLRARAAPAARAAYRYTWIDSWEVGPQNWTAAFPAEFRQRRGYAITPWLPVLAGGRIVATRDRSERFLWDFRRTIADLLVDHYWKRSQALAHQRGMEFRAESFGRQQFLYDPVNYARACDMPCGEFWVGGGPRVDCKVAASAAHLSGRQIVGAEAFTSGRGQWLDDPWSLKTLGDRAFTLGINQYYFHRYAHQPWLRLRPGMTFGPYGINFERTNTWWRPGKAWIDYLARCQAVLQQGRFAADVLVMLDEGAPTYGGWRNELPIPLPPGYDYDFANLDALRESRVEQGIIVHPGGMRYRVLMLPGNGRATPALLGEVRRLAEAGAIIAAPRAIDRAPGLEGDAETVALWKAVIATGRLVLATDFAAIEQRAGLSPDFAHDRDEELLWIHRADEAADAKAPPHESSPAGSITPLRRDWYFVSNQSDAAFDAVCTFRVAGRQPELWDPASGSRRQVGRFESCGGRTAVQIPFDPRGSWFVVFRGPASAPALKPVPRAPETDRGRELPGQSPTVINTFGLLLRALPTMEIELPRASDKGIVPMRGQNFAVATPQGELMFGPGHATAGLSVGRNGAVVWEHGARYLVPRIVALQRIEEMAHLALVYRAGRPSLYINGRLIGTAGPSPLVVHPGGRGSFHGQIEELRLVPDALSAEEIAQRAKKHPGSPPQTSLWIEGGRLVEEVESAAPLVVRGGWNVGFPANSGAPASILLERLTDLSRSAVEGVRHFSGTAVYQAQFDALGPSTRDARTLLDLGEVFNLAEVLVNGRNLGALWKKPFRVDATDALRAGENQLEVRITNLWVNRLVGDSKQRAALGIHYQRQTGPITKWPDWVPQDRPPPGAPLSFATWCQWTGDEPLPPSGLLGPVTLRRLEKRPRSSR